jgi:hypothetical protein
MTASLGSKHLKDQIGKAVDHQREAIEARCRIDHAEHPEPGRDPIEIPQLAFQAAQNGECRVARGIVSLLLRDLRADLAQRLGNRAIGLQRDMP